MANTTTAATALIPKTMTRAMCFNPDRLYEHFAYKQGCEFVDTAGALSLTVRNTVLDVSGTKAFTVGAPSFLGQEKFVTQRTGASTPAGTVTVTGMRIATSNVISGFDQTTAQLDSAPRNFLLTAAVTSATDSTPVWDVILSGVTIA